MTKPHKHSELIKAWADGAEIESLTVGGNWFVCDAPTWHPDRTYRIKPKPEVVRYRVALMREGVGGCRYFTETADAVLSDKCLSLREHFIRWITDWQEETV